MHSEFPLSYPQERFWLLDQLYPDNPAYNMGKVFLLKGLLNEEALQKSFNYLHARHEALRTTFPAPEGIPYQKVNPVTELKVEFIDYQPEPDQVPKAVDQAINRLYQLDRDCLTRPTVFKFAPDQSVLLVAQHHIISDATSAGLLLNELGACYDAFCEGTEPDLPALTLTYSEHSREQRTKLAEPGMLDKLAYWEASLKDAPILDLPTDRPRPKIQTFDGKRYQHIYPPENIKQLRMLGAKNGVTLFMMLLAAFNILLHKLSRQSDIIVGTPIAGRNRVATEKIQGLFLNTLALRTKFPEDKSFQALLAAIKSTALQAYSRMDIPFEKVIETLQPPRDQSRPPFFQIMINMFPEGAQPLKMNGLQVEPYPHVRESAKFDITLYLSDSPTDGLNLSWAYNTGLYDEARIAQMAAQYTHLLDQILTNPETSIDDLTLITPAARALLPDPALPLENPAYPTVPQMIAEWAARAPESPALQDDESTWTYQEFFEHSQQIAQSLLSEGIEKGDVVAVTGESSNQLVAHMLGVWLAGGVLLTLNPDFPAAQKTRILEIGKAKRLLDADSEVLPAPDKAIPFPEINPDDPAYIFFTSGTTGTPKGILGTHNGVGHFLDWQRNEFKISPADRIAQTTKLSFDVLLRDVFLVLTSGGTLVMSNSDHFRFNFLNWTLDEKITRFHMVPALLKFWLKETTSIGYAQDDLKTVFLSGEPLEAGLIDEFQTLLGTSAELVNLYGPSETTMAKSYLRIGDAHPPGIQPIGKPMPHTQFLILNNANQLCGLFEPGEIVIRTPYQTLGYLNASNEPFIQNPFSDDPRDIVYRTGDIGWYLPDGSIAIGGRLDDQVKVRGMRVEPGAIISILDKHPEVNNSVVLPFHDDEQNLFLAAYVVLNQDSGITADQIFTYLQENLQQSHIPSAIIPIEKIPLTANGKVDRAALPEPIFNSEPSTENGLPRNETEQNMAAIWAEVLHAKQVSMQARFFDAGGHSLLAVQILNRVRELFGIEIPLFYFFENPSVREMCEMINEITAVPGNKPGSDEA
jgi:amino acid adenylation domain-containing protein